MIRDEMTFDDVLRVENKASVPRHGPLDAGNFPLDKWVKGSTPSKISHQILYDIIYERKKISRFDFSK